MKTVTAIARHILLLFAVLTTCVAPALSETPSAAKVIAGLLEIDPWGMAGAEMKARARLIDKGEAESVLEFSVSSLRHDPPFAKSLVRFTAPADLAGAGFLQIQNRDRDDDRFLFLPELKRSRRISGNLRGNSFMGTDFSFADLDRRDLRESQAALRPDAKVGGHDCWEVQTKPQRSDSPYSSIELWIRKDNYLPLKMKMYNRAGVLAKTFTAKEVKRVSEHWYITQSTMVDHTQSHTTELFIDAIKPGSALAEGEFTVRNLEKL